MNSILRISSALAVVALAGCAGYGYPGSGSGYGGYPPVDGYGNQVGSYGYPPPTSGYPVPGAGGYGATLRCESNDGRTQTCAADTRGGVRLSRRLSNTDCIQGRNWGYDNRAIWVTGGCRAEFVTGAGSNQPGYGSGYGQPGYGQPAYGSGQVVRCESQDGRLQHCSAPVRSGAAITKELSRTHCVQGQNWGWDRSGVWVNGGCRGEFRIY